MRVLIACEFSGIVRETFRRRGHDAVSCDLLPAEDGSVHHVIGDAVKTADRGIWDLIIAHPPCTLLCNSGVRWLAPKGKLDSVRHKAMQEACDFFAALYHVSAYVAVENPIMHGYAKDYLQSAYKVPSYSQIIQPWMFGHGETKATCLWLKNLPKLQPTNIVEGRKPRVHYASPSPDRWKERSRTLQGIADAMAEQWGSLGTELLIPEAQKRRK